MFLFFCFLLPIAAYYFYSILSAKVPRLEGKQSGSLYKKALKHFTFLKEPYYAPWWAQNGIVMTVARNFQSLPSLPFNREIFSFPDGGITALDWLFPENSPENTPILILLPGVVGHTYDGSYLYNPAKEAFKKGWKVVVLNRRGVDVPLKTPKMFCSDNTEDLVHIFEALKSRYPEAKKMGCGFSLGGQILFNYLATRTSKNSIINFGMSVSAPFSNGDAAKRMDHWMPRLLVCPPFMKGLIKGILPHEQVLYGHVNYNQLKKAKSLRDFDSLFTAPLAGFNDEDHYYAVTRLHSKVSRVPIPFLVLTAEDDFLVHPEDIPFEKIAESENVISVVTAHGGHTAFMESSDINARGFAEKVLFGWTDMHLSNKE